MLHTSRIEPAFFDHNIAVIFATDSHYAEIVSVAIQSLVNHANESISMSNYDILLIADGLTEDQLGRIASIAEGKSNISIRFLDADPFRELSKSYHFHYLSVAAFYRLCLPSMLPAYEKILYLDCDILIRADVAELYNTELGANLIAGVQDRAVEFLVNEWIKNPLQKLKFNGLRRDKYFNSGVVLMNLKQMRLENTESFFKALSTRTDLVWLDQDILNMAAKDCWISLPDRWNHTLHMYLPYEITQDGSAWASLLNDDVAIIHYACGSRKPWDFWPSQFEQQWWETAMHSPAREKFLYHLPKHEEEALQSEVEGFKFPTLPDPEMHWDAFYHLSKKIAHINYLRRMKNERNQQTSTIVPVYKKSVQLITPVPESVVMDQQDVPLLTVITPTFNLVKAGRVDHFKQSLQSVRNQTYSNIEHIVIDGGSTDGTLDLLQEIQKRGDIKFISEPDGGIYDAMNKGTLLAQGKYVAYLNTDDYWHNPEGMSMSIQMLEKSGADFSYAPYTYLHPDGYQIKFQPALGAFITRMPFCHQAMVIRKDSLVSLGLYDANLKIAADYGYVIEVIKRKRPVVFVPLDYTLFRMGGICCTDVDTCYHECAILLSRAFHGNDEWVPFFDTFCRDQTCCKEIFHDIRAQVSPELQKMMDDMVQPLFPAAHTLVIQPNPHEKIYLRQDKRGASGETRDNDSTMNNNGKVRNNVWIKLFNCLPLIKVKMRPSVDLPEKTVYKLFGVLPLMKVRQTVSRTSYYLFNILPIAKIKYKSPYKKCYYVLFIPICKSVR